ncbi:MAG: type II toxin-antitoxin system VapC family toxin [Euzebyales bacterium]|nr:type II toxin-antitoxin system VapC family toxin [Euzebyales bacterium]
MIGYFDSSALVKLVVEEAGSDEAAALWDGADVVLSSRVAHAEVRAALAAARRAGWLNHRQLADAKDLWAVMWNALRLVEVSVEVSVDLGQLSGDLAEEHALSGLDAIHLALLLPADDLTIATWDSRLHAAAHRMALATLPAKL